MIERFSEKRVSPQPGIDFIDWIRQGVETGKFRQNHQWLNVVNYPERDGRNRVLIGIEILNAVVDFMKRPLRSEDKNSEAEVLNALSQMGLAIVNQRMYQRHMHKYKKAQEDRYLTLYLFDPDLFFPRSVVLHANPQLSLIAELNGR